MKRLLLIIAFLLMSCMDVSEPEWAEESDTMGAGLTPIPLVWASSGSADTENPEIEEPGKTILGWVTDERPALEWENFTKNRSEVAINAITTYLNTGIPLRDLLLSSTTLDKFDFDDGAFQEWNQDINSLEYIYDNTGTLEKKAYMDWDNLYIDLVTPSIDKRVLVRPDDVQVQDNVRAIKTLVTADGISYDGTSNPGNTDVLNTRKAMFNAGVFDTGGGWTQEGSSSIYASAENLTLTGLPFASGTNLTYSAWFRYNTASGASTHIVPAYVNIADSGGGVMQVTNIMIFSPVTPVGAADPELVIEFDGSIIA